MQHTKTALLLALLVACDPVVGQVKRARRDAPQWLADLRAAEREVGVGVRFMSVQVAALFGRPQSLSVLVVDPSARFDVAKSNGLERTSAIAHRSGALAAVNGGYFHKDGSPNGYLKCDGAESGQASYAGQAGLGIDKRGRVFLGLMPPQNKTTQKNLLEGIGCGPMLVQKSRVVDHGEKQRQVRHPRTAVGLRTDGSAVFVVADGRTEQAAGLSFEELGRIFVALDCHAAVNLDGGGSSTMWIRGTGANGIVNHPCDNKRFDHLGERRVGNVVLIDAPAVITLDNDQAVVPHGRLEKRVDGRGYFGRDFLYTKNATDLRVAWRFTPTADGSYRVLVRWPRVGFRQAATATLRIGDRERELHQGRGGGKWIEIGTVRGKTGESLEVALRGRAGKPLLVDAVRFVEIERRK